MQGGYPIIIIGMHRSGTTMVTDLLSRKGFFVGLDKDVNSESIFFAQLNNWILSQSGSSWDHPAGFDLFWKDKVLRACATEYLRKIIASKKCVSFLGRRNFEKYKCLSYIEFPWGWKDPRNTITLPLWLEIFPNARVVHMKRNGIDVANSLKIRSQTEKNRFVKKLAENKLFKKGAFRHRDGLRGLIGSFRCSELTGGFTLWKEYLDAAEKNIAVIQDRAMTLRYEELLLEPVDLLDKLFQFCGLSVSQKEILEVAGTMHKDRGNAYLQDPELLSYSQKVKSELEKYGYE